MASTAGAVQYVTSSGGVADASSGTDPRTIAGVATTSGTSGQQIFVAGDGIIYTYSGLTPGTRYWMDPTTGLPTATAPSSGLLLQMGYAVSTTGLSIQLVAYASATYPGQVQVDGTSITVNSSGVISASAPQHIVGTGTAPTIAAGVGAGTSPTVAVTGHDLAGQISVTSGTLPLVSAVIFTLTFNAAFSAAPYIVFSPANSATALLSGATMVFVTSTTTTFTFTAGPTGLAGATAYLWNYVVIG